MPGEKLEFQKQEPAFLRKLREQHGGPRNNVQIARPKKDRLRTGEDGEDDPVIVDEAGEDVAKEDWEERLRREKDGPAEMKDESTVGAADAKSAVEAGLGREKQKEAEIGAIKKRKAGKVIAEDEAEQDGHDDGTKTKSKSKTGPDFDDLNSAAEGVTKKPKKKAKKIKLSFDEPERG